MIYEAPGGVPGAHARLLQGHRLRGGGAMIRVGITAVAAAVWVALFVSVFVMLLSGRAQAQEVNLARLDEGPANRVYVRTGAEWAFVAGVGYARTVAVGQRRLVLLGELTAPWAAADASDYQARVGALVPILAWRGWRLAGSLEPTGARHEERPWPHDQPGRERRRDGRLLRAGTGSLAGELGFDYTLTTRIAHRRSTATPCTRTRATAGTSTPAATTAWAARPAPRSAATSWPCAPAFCATWWAASRCSRSTRRSPSSTGW